MENLVEFFKDQNHVVTAPECHMYSKKGDTIKWKNDTDTNYTIYFDDCPLRDNNVTVPAKGMSKAIALNDKVSPKTYAYEIRPAKAMSGSVTAADPNVIVH
jgi:plastocyanin